MRQGRIMCAGRVLANKTECASSFLDRLRGLLGRSSLGPDSALLIERCGSIHTVGMRFAIDAVFLDRAWHVVRIVRNIRPGRLMVCGGWRAARVLESETGCLDLAGIQVGGELAWNEG